MGGDGIGGGGDEEQPLTLRSRRVLSLRFSIPISKTRRFWEALAEGRVETTKCTDCGELSFPPQVDCPRCNGRNVEWVGLGTDSELLTYTFVRFAPGSFVESDPYIVAIGRMTGGGPNILAWLEGAAIGDLRPGMKMKLEVRKRDEDGGGGSPFYYVFVLAPAPPLASSSP